MDRGVAADVMLVFLAAFGVRVFWAAITPPWLAPDEPSHFSYVAHLVENGEIPDPATPDPRYPDHSPEYETSCELTLCAQISGHGARPTPMKLLPLDHDYAHARAHRFDAERRKTRAGSTATAYPALYYAIAAIPYRALYDHPILTRLLGARIASAWLSALTCVFGYLFAFEINKSRLWGRSVALSLAFVPMHAFIGSSVNNDAAMFAGTAALWWLFARMWFANEPSLTSACVLGATASVAMLGKPSAAPLVIPAALLVIVKAIHSSKGWSFEWRAAVPIALFGSGFALIQCFRYVYRSMHAHVAVAVAPGAGAGKSDVLKAVLGEAQYSLGDYLHNLLGRGESYFKWLFIKQVWGVFGWLEVSLPETVYTAIGLMMAACALGLLVRLWTRPTERTLVVSLLAAIAFNVAALFLAADYVLAFSARGSTYGMQGRYFYGTLVPFMFLLINGLCGLVGERAWVLRAAPFPVVVLHIMSVLVMLESYYGISVR